MNTQLRKCAFLIISLELFHELELPVILSCCVKGVFEMPWVGRQQARSRSPVPTAWRAYPAVSVVAHLGDLDFLIAISASTFVFYTFIIMTKWISWLCSTCAIQIIPLYIENCQESNLCAHGRVYLMWYKSIYKYKISHKKMPTQRFIRQHEVRPWFWGVFGTQIDGALILGRLS